MSRRTLRCARSPVQWAAEALQVRQSPKNSAVGSHKSTVSPHPPRRNSGAARTASFLGLFLGWGGQKQAPFFRTALSVGTVYCPGCGLGTGSNRALATRLAVCAVFGVLLVAVSVFSLSVAAKATPEPAGAGGAVCSELSERRDWLLAEIARLHAATALVEAQLVLLCTERSNLSDVSAPPLLALPSQSPGGTADQATGMQQTAQQLETALARPCGVGDYAVNERSCAPCPPGSGSGGGAATACTQCQAGARPPSLYTGPCLTHASFLAGRWVLQGFVRSSCYSPEMV
jgi:hypothetical protein